MTSLAGLAFMASGSSPGRGPYGSQIDKAMAYVMQNTSPSGFIAVYATSTHGPMYSHGFGTLFLAEAYGMTHRPEIREKLQKAVRLIIDSQNIEGGWRYQPVRRDADLSVTICQINALRAARNAGLFIPKETVDACIRYVKKSQNADGGFRYMLQAGATSEFPRSAAGIVALQSAGEYDSKEVRDGIAYLRQARQGMRLGRRNNHYFYGQYYAAQAMWLAGRRALGGVVSGGSNELINRQSSAGILDRQRCLQRVWYGDGLDHLADSQRLLADLSTMSGRAPAVLDSPEKMRERGRYWLIRLVTAIGVFTSLGTSERPAVAGSISSDSLFKALTIDGRTFSGRLIGLGPGALKLLTADGTPRELAIGQLIKLSRESAAVLPAADMAHVIFPEGDCLMRTTIGQSTETSLEVNSDALGKLAVPLDAILGLMFANEKPAADNDTYWEHVRLEPRSTEVVWLANGDRLTGAFLGLDESKIKIQNAGRTVAVDRAGVIALGFNPRLVSYPRPASDFLDLALKDGTRLGVTEARLEDGMILATTRYGAAIKFSVNELARVHARTQSVVYLSERKVVRDQYLSYIGPTREYRVDRTVDGHVFQLGGQTYDRGLGTQSATYLAYRIEAGDRRFQGLVGVDERAGPLGSVVFRVLVDGKERFKTTPLTAHDPPREFDVDLAGGKYLILATEFGDRGNMRDLADWVETRIIR